MVASEAKTPDDASDEACFDLVSDVAVPPDASVGVGPPAPPPFCPGSALGNVWSKKKTALVID